MPGVGVAAVLGTAARKELRDRLLKRFGRNLTTLGPLLTGAAVASYLNRRATRALASEIRKDLRSTPAPGADPMPDGSPTGLSGRSRAASSAAASSVGRRELTTQYGVGSAGSSSTHLHRAARSTAAAPRTPAGRRRPRAASRWPAASSGDRRRRRTAAGSRASSTRSSPSATATRIRPSHAQPGHGQPAAAPRRAARPRSAGRAQPDLGGEQRGRRPAPASQHHHGRPSRSAYAGGRRRLARRG